MTEDDDRARIAEMVKSVYAMLSGPAGPRDYGSVKHYYLPDARLIRTGVDKSGHAFADIMSVDDHHADVDRKLADIAFLEEEISHDCELFGHVARVRSVYKSVYGEGPDAAVGRGVNFFNIVRVRGEWKIASCVWDNEREGLSLAD